MAFNLAKHMARLSYYDIYKIHEKKPAKCGDKWNLTLMKKFWTVYKTSVDSSDILDATDDELFFRLISEIIL